jgi:hypothetical protein
MAGHRRDVGVNNDVGKENGDTGASRGRRGNMCEEGEFDRLPRGTQAGWGLNFKRIHNFLGFV